MGVHLKASNANYVSAEGGGGGIVNANRQQASTWETFEISVVGGGVLLSGANVQLRTSSGYYLSEYAGGGGLDATKRFAGDWETFKMAAPEVGLGLPIPDGAAILKVSQSPAKRFVASKPPPPTY